MDYIQSFSNVVNQFGPKSCQQKLENMSKYILQDFPANWKISAWNREQGVACFAIIVLRMKYTGFFGRQCTNKIVTDLNGGKTICEQKLFNIEYKAFWWSKNNIDITVCSLVDLLWYFSRSQIRIHFVSFCIYGFCSEVNKS